MLTSGNVLLESERAKPRERAKILSRGGYIRGNLRLAKHPSSSYRSCPEKCDRNTLHQTLHRFWIRKQQEKYADAKFTEWNLEGTPLCQNCFCAGNTECGHKPLGEDCALVGEETCKCCLAEPKPMCDQEYDEAVGQLNLCDTIPSKRKQHDVLDLQSNA